MFRLVLTTKAKKQLAGFKKSHQLAIALVFEELKDDPFSGKSLTRELTGRFSYRVGVYRIIYSVNQKDKIIRILNSGHRALIYK